MSRVTSLLGCNQPFAHTPYFQPLPALLTMSPRSTRTHNRTSAPATRKRRESDPNERPKKRTTRQSKGEPDEQDESKEGKVERGARKGTGRNKKAR